ncbi:lycopene cyclase domain-containing protein [Agromyces terreus]|uniref:Lycopene cyclase domain-containing protein n=1 Tax=Agromyces terreus TaxID=424795 RepID=A0A9X2H351_9MICO|nr:lycopene cyclase domain-containing protein [Agromyces terreus]MCP2371673.1 lycopene cyclase domain-containing protein [Agromyces terreus]
MTGFTYLGLLLLSIAAIAAVDVRWRLAFRRAPLAASVAVACGTVLLLVWDLVGIGFGVFFRGDSVFATGLLLAPDLPIEEPVFLVFLCQLSLVAVLGVERLLGRRPGATDAGATDAGPTTVAAASDREARA